MRLSSQLAIWRRRRRRSCTSQINRTTGGPRTCRLPGCRNNVPVPLLETRQLTRRFPGVLALDRVDFVAEAGEVHALVGANGAGKSTLMNLLAGLFPPSGGEIRLAGRSVIFPHPAAARASGISIVYQESSAIPELTVAENIYLGYEPANRL